MEECRAVAKPGTVITPRGADLPLEGDRSAIHTLAIGCQPQILDSILVSMYIHTIIFPDQHVSLTIPVNIVSFPLLHNSGIICQFVGLCYDIYRFQVITL